MDFCKRFSRIAITRPTRGKVLLTRLRCGEWSCDYCARQNQKIWRGFLHEKLPLVSAEWQMVTLTASSKTRTAIDSYKNLQSGIDTLIKRIRRVHGSIEYVRTYEKHPSSEALHAHFIMSGLSPFVVPGCWKNLQPGYLAVLVRSWRVGVWTLQTYLKKQAQECKMGYMAHVLPLPSDKAVNYVTKYLTKDLQGIDIKGLRHVQTTRGIGSPKSESEYQWTVSDYVTARDFEAGETVIDLQTGAALDAEYWTDFDRYPIENT